MRRFMFVVLTLFISLLFCINVSAQTVLETLETNEGSIKLSLSFDEGYVGAIDASIKVQGNVLVNNLVWDNSLSAYTKRYSYDANSRVIRIIISTGDTSKNLLDKYGNLNIGELSLSNGTSDSQIYSFSIMDVDMVDAEYKAYTNLSVSDGSVSEYILKVDNAPVSPIVPSTPDYTENNNSSSNIDNNNTNNNTTNNVSTSPGYDGSYDNYFNQTSEEESIEEETEEDIEDDTDESINIPIINDNKGSNSNKDNSEAKDVETHNQRIVRYLWMTLGGLIIVAIILAGIYAKKQNKLNKVQ